MPRYFFDLQNDVDARDEQGRFCADPEAARAHAVDEARQMACASITDSGSLDLRHRINVRDDGDRIVSVIYFEDAVRITRSGEPL